MKIIAYYLPQFHSIKENDEWWGEGFTEWDNVRKAKPLFNGHIQPRVPLNNNYYNLLNPEVQKWQVSLAKKYGVYGFCFYHYWLGGKLLLEKPIENYLKFKELDLPFCLCWANHNWTNEWSSKNRKILMEQTYGGESDWVFHFQYLLPYFKDERYIKEDGHPLFVIYNPGEIESLEEMLAVWTELAIKNGFPGIRFLNQNTRIEDLKEKEKLFNYHIEYQPTMAGRWEERNKVKILRRCKQYMDKILDNLFHTTFFSRRKIATGSGEKSYDACWNSILRHVPESEKWIPGAFVNWDNTPRKGSSGSWYLGMTVEKFENYLFKQIKRASEVYHKDYLFLFAWNEWGEGGFLEPVEDEGYGRLEAIKNALEKNDEN